MILLQSNLTIILLKIVNTKSHCRIDQNWYYGMICNNLGRRDFCHHLKVLDRSLYSYQLHEADIVTQTGLSEVSYIL